MRLDKYLKVTRLIKRRTVGNEACDAGKVSVNGKVARASYDVKLGDVIVHGVLTWDGGLCLLIFVFFALIIVNLLLKAWVDKRGGSTE